MHGAFRNGVEISGWKIKNSLNGAYWLFHDSPARREDYIAQTACSEFPFSFTGTRWLENDTVSERFVKLFPHLKVTVQFYENKPPSQRPKSKSYVRLRDAVHDPLILPKMDYFAFIAKKFTFFLTFYQTDAPVVPFLHAHLVTLITSLMDVFVKKDAVDGIKTLVDFRNFETKKTDILPTSNIGRWIGCL